MTPCLHTMGCPNTSREIMNTVIFALMLLFGMRLGCFGQAQTGTEPASKQNVVVPSACGASNPPSWCSGSDIGAWTNAAIAYLGASGTIYIPDGQYNYATTIRVSQAQFKALTIQCGSRSAILNYTGNDSALYVTSNLN